MEQCLGCGAILDREGMCPNGCEPEIPSNINALVGMMNSIPASAVQRVSYMDSGLAAALYQDENRMKSRKLHEIKTWPDAFQAMWDGDKSFEFRLDDRNYEVGDSALSREYVPLQESIEANPDAMGCLPVGYTGRAIFADIIYKIKGGRFGIPEGYCIMQFAGIHRFEERK